MKYYREERKLNHIKFSIKTREDRTRINKQKINEGKGQQI